MLALMIKHQIKVEPERIPWEENEMADYFSRIIDKLFGMLDELWGPHTIDRFANTDNTQIERFNSRFWCPGLAAVDAFTMNWNAENNWLCPPMSLVLHVLKYALGCKAQGTLIVPLWRSAPYWPLLCPDGSNLVEFVDDWYNLPFCKIPCSSLVNLVSSFLRGITQYQSVSTENELSKAFLPGGHVQGAVQSSHVITLIAQ